LNNDIFRNIQALSKKTFLLTIEQFDLFGIDLGKWNESQHPERENIINEALKKIEKEFKTKINILECIREVK
jgi:hypothetical protein